MPLFPVYAFLLETPLHDTQSLLILMNQAHGNGSLWTLTLELLGQFIRRGKFEESIAMLPGVFSGQPLHMINIAAVISHPGFAILVLVHVPDVKDVEMKSLNPESPFGLYPL